MNLDLAGDYELANDIDADSFDFQPVGDSSNRFTGTFDGCGYKISNLTINKATYYLGLFGYAQEATLEDVAFENVSITGSNSDYIGSLVGYAYACTVQDIEVISSVIRGLRYYVGGVIGYARYSPTIIARCTAQVDVYSDTSGQYVGGVVGYAGDAAIEDCSADVTIDVQIYYIGGVVGYLIGDTATRCYAVGAISAYEDAGGFSGLCDANVSKSHTSVDVICFSTNYSSGGFIGWNDYGTISNCYSTGSVTHYATGSNRGVGGFCGYNYGSITNCYSIGSVTGEDDSGGFCGRNNGYIASCFWDTEESGTVHSQGGEGKTTSELKSRITFPGWDMGGTFESVNDGYPFLGWQVNDSTTWLIYPLQFNLHRKTSSPQDKSFKTLRRFSINDSVLLRNIKNIVSTGSTNRKLVSDILAGSVKSVRDIRHELPTKLFRAVRDFGAGYSGKFTRLISSVFGATRPISIQRGSITLSGSASSVLLDTPVEVGKSFVICSTRGTASAPSSSMVRVNLSDVVGDNYTKITATRNSTTGTCYVEWQVISGNQFSVQSGSIACNASYKDINISKVDLSKSFIFVSSTTNSANIYRGLVRAKFNSDTQIEIRKGDTDTANFPTVQWYVVEWDGASVQSGLVTNSSQINTANISGIDLDKAFLAYNYYVTTTVSNSAYAFVRGRFSSNSQVEFMRGSSTNSAYVSYFAISHPDITVSSGLMTVSGTSGTANVGAESFLPVTSVGNAYQTSTGTGTLHQGYNTHNLSGTTLTVERTNSTGTLYASWFAVEAESTVVPQPKFSSVRKLSDVFSELKKSARLTASAFPAKLFKTFRGFGAEYFGNTIRRIGNVFGSEHADLPLPKFSSVRKITNVVSEFKRSVRLTAVEFPIKLFNTFRIFATTYIGKTIRRPSRNLSYYSGVDRLYRIKIVITESGGGDYNNFPTLIDVPFCNGMNNDFSDVLFTEPNGTILIPFGLRSKTDGVTAKFVIVRNYKALESQSIYIYYGKSGATSSAVSFSSWVDTWYTNNHFGGGSGAYSNTTCSQYPRTRSGVVPAWAGDVFYIGGVPDSYASTGNVFTGRSYINSTLYQVAWASTSVCNGLYTQSLCPYGRRYRNTPSLNNAGWNRGATNTVYFGHYDASNQSISVAWLPVNPEISLSEVESTTNFSTVRRLVNVVTESFTSLRGLNIFADFIGKTVRTAYIALASVLTIRKISSIIPTSVIPSEFSTTRRLINVVTESFKSVRRPSVAFSKLFSTLRLFSFRALFKNIRSITWSLAQPKRYTYTYKGQWVITNSYTKDDMVWYNVGGTDKTYKAVVNNSGNQVTETDYWEYLYDGRHKFNTPDECTYVDVLVVAGGGGGGSYIKYVFGHGQGGGGGAGGLVFIEDYSITKYLGEVSISIGTGGAGGTSGSSGQNSNFGDLISVGGGGGRISSGLDGGSGGGHGSESSVPGVSIQPTTNDGYENSGFGHDGGSYVGGGAGSSGPNGSHGMVVWGVTYASGGINSAAQPNTGAGGGYTGSSPGHSGGSGIVIVKYENKPHFQTNRKLSSDIIELFKTLRFPSIITSYLAKTLRLFKATFFGATYRFGINVITAPFKVNRRLSSDITTIFSTVRRPSIIAGYIGSTLRQFGFVFGFITNRTTTIMSTYVASMNRKLSSVFVDKFKVLRFPSMFYQWLGSTFRRVGELCIDLINRVTFPPKE